MRQILLDGARIQGYVNGSNFSHSERANSYIDLSVSVLCLTGNPGSPVRLVVSGIVAFLLITEC
jgi:hypothetical protein